MKKTCIYIHIPYCKKRCMYCSFFSSCPPHNDIKEYVNALKQEIISYSGKFNAVKTVYFGGGTPSYIPPQYICQILQVIKDNYSLSPKAEITIEANPDTISAQNVQMWKEGGVNRYSVGLQSANNDILKSIGRIHTAEDFIRGINHLKNAGIQNINADIMLGLPNQTEKDVTATLDVLKELDIPHISAYGLKVEQNTELFNMLKRGEITLPSDDQGADMYNIVYAALKKQGIYRYEVSNFAKKGYECKHNLNYWQRGDYAGFGTSAHAFLQGQRQENICDIKEYIKRKGINCTQSSTAITSSEAEFEYIILGLRLSKGINTADFKKLFNEDFEIKYAEILKKLKKFFIKRGNNISVSKEGFNVLNGILAYFVP